MKKKKLIPVFAFILSLSFVLVACSTSGTSTSSSQTSGVLPAATKGTLEVESCYDNQIVSNSFQTLCDQFEAQYPNITVIDTNVGFSNYSQIMEVKIASNNLPDVFESYSMLASVQPHVYNLQNEPWVSKIMSSAVTDCTFNKSLVAMPLGWATTGLEYNVGLLSQYGIDPNKDLGTFAQWLAACKKIHDKSNGSVYALYIGGGDGWPLGLFYNIMGDTAFAENNPTQQAALLGGTFNWSSQWVPFVEQMKQMAQYFNPDYLTAKNATLAQTFAEGKVAFDWGSMDVPAIQPLNSNIKFSFVPLPAWKAGEAPMFVGDIRTSFSAWNDSQVLGDSRLFLNFLSQPSQMKLMGDVSGYQATETGVDVAGIDNARYAQFASAPVMSIFANEYIPTQLWPTLVQDAAEYNSGSWTAQQFASDMQSNYLRLYPAWKASMSST